MTYPLPESAATLAAMETQMRASHRVRTLVQLQDYQHRVIRDLTSVRISGTVQVDADAEQSTRGLTLELLDPTDMLGLSTGERIASQARMVQVWKSIYVEAVESWIDTPVFCGPLSKPNRGGDVLSIEAKDKVTFAADPRETYTVKAGTNKATAIKQLMAAACGETRFRVASTSERMQDDHTVDSKERSAWDLVKLICKSLGWVCFYDGAGYLVCKPRPTTPVTEFRSGPGGSLTGEVDTGFWDEEIVNRVTVTGGVVSRTTITASVTVEAGHPLSPENLRTNVGERRWFKTEYIEDTNISSYSQALALAKRRLLERSVQQASSTFEALPFWHIQEHDPFAVETSDGMVVSRLSKTSIPLSSEGAQSFGYLTATGQATRRPMRIRGKNPYLSKAEQKVAASKRRAAATQARKARR